MSETILNWAFETGLAVTLLVAFVLLVRKSFARRFGPRLTYALWALPAIRLFMPAIVLPALPEPTHIQIEESFSATALDSALSFAPTQTAAIPSINWSVLLISLWLGGAVIWLAWQIRQQAKFRQTVTRETQSLPRDLERMADQLSTRIGVKNRPDILMSSEKIGPLVTGVWRPVIILPRSFDQDYTDKQQRFALGHELTHIRRRDLWAALTALIFRALNWPNPLVHYAAAKFRADQEAACDASLLERLGDTQSAKHDYAETLLHAARQTIRVTQPRPLGLTIYHPLKERLMILNTTNTQASALTRVMATALIASAIVISAPFTRAEGPQTELAGDDSEVTMNLVDKKVIKWVEKKDGVETTKHYEITTENGETKAFEIDEFGNKIEVDPDSIEGLKMHGKHAILFKDGDFPHGIEKRMKIMVDGDFHGKTDEEKRAFIEKLKAKHGDMSDEKRHLIIEKLTEGDGSANVFAFDIDEDVTLDMNGNAFAFSSSGHHAKGLVGAAESLAKKAEKSEDLTRDQRRKLEKAIKALAEAQEALAEE